MRKRELSPKEKIILALAKEHSLPIHVIEEIVLYQFDSLLEGMMDPNVHSAELTGFGKFIFQEGKARRSLESLIFNLSKEKNAEKMKAMSNILGNLKTKIPPTYEQVYRISETSSQGNEE